MLLRVVFVVYRCAYVLTNICMIARVARTVANLTTYNLMKYQWPQNIDLKSIHTYTITLTYIEGRLWCPPLLLSKSATRNSPFDLLYPWPRALRPLLCAVYVARTRRFKSKLLCVMVWVYCVCFLKSIHAVF